MILRSADGKGVGPKIADMPQPPGDLVPTGAGLVHQNFISGLDSPQVAESGCGCGGSNKAISVERNSVGKEQLLDR